MSLFDAIRERVPIEDVARRYGVEVIRGKARCPFHEDRRPSAKLYEHTLHCFVCGKSWDAVALVAGLEGLTMLEAAQRLAGEYGVGGQNTQSSPRPAVTVADARRAVEAFKTARWGKWCDALHGADAAVRAVAKPDTAWENPTFVLALRARDEAEIELDIMEHMSTREWVDLFRREVRD